MSHLGPRDADFLAKATEIIEGNISNERFGVSDLAREIGMSRSNLLRKIRKLSNLSVSQFIRQVRLSRAMQMLKQEDLTVSEISYRVGFSSTSYFTKCFREQYGYPPGEVGKRKEKEAPASTGSKQGKKPVLLISGLFILLLASILLIIIVRPWSKAPADLEKSIAVLPFKNDSNDSTNIYIINGLMESILENLQKIEDLRVISRTSVEKYRNNPRTSPEIARELNANYLVEGSGQKIGDQILLNIQLIEAVTDRHLLAKRYKRETDDIFELQQEVARSIAGEIEAIITPEEAAQIERIPTENLEAYDYYLQGLDRFQRETREGLEESLPLFKKAIDLDPEFALAYAYVAIAYSYLDMFLINQVHLEQIDYYADRALLLDPKLPQSLVAKAWFHYTREEYDLALPYLEKALEYHPNSSRIINLLSDYYTSYVPDTEKYLEYALMGIELDIAAYDSVEAGYIYLHLSNALMQSGFVEEAKKYIDISLEYNAENFYARLLRPYIFLAGGTGLAQTREMLLKVLEEYPDRLEIIKELGVICYFMKDYPCAYEYLNRLFEVVSNEGMELYSGEKAKMAIILAEMGQTEESRRYLNEYLEFAEKDESVYKHLSLAAYYSYVGDTDRAIEHMRIFAQQEGYPYWYVLFLEMDDPLFHNVEDLPEFQNILADIKARFWDHHDQVKHTLKSKGLL
jgi:TolB-like protein/AraC-like DNA-binding protein/Tfp pilus assembly protein PilF